ncbi:NepR family anti-sigma factor [Tsuneonella sp. HG094]
MRSWPENWFECCQGRDLTLEKRKSAIPPRKEDKRITTAAPSTDRGPGSPGWANGLRQLYDSVVDEPLPDTFKDLLSKLDQKN